MDKYIFLLKKGLMARYIHSLARLRQNLTKYEAKKHVDHTLVVLNYFKKVYKLNSNIYLIK